MQKIIFLFMFCLVLTACSSAKVPQVGAAVPCQIQSVAQVNQALLAGLADQDWEIISASDHIVEARKKKSQMEAMIHIAYGYRGFSIEYFDSKNMDFNAETDTISSTYVNWVYRLLRTTEKILQKEVKQLPPIKCSSLKDQYQQKA